ncbi:MAG: ABC transporter substrate-binding protein [Flavobacteriales bacterium]|nr:ABC transporter substrate-binding protein [Flavobacteriales bacterium]
MKKRSNIFIPALIVLSVILCGLTAKEIRDITLNPKQEAGKVVYEKGTGSGEKEIIAVLSEVKVPASVLFCANCHGKEGEGKPEGGVSPSKLTWKSLTKNYGGKTTNGRQHPAYDVKSLKRAITMGIDPAGNQLSSVMPRYQMSLEDLTNLVEYIKVLGSNSETGLNDTTIHIGMLLPSPRKFPVLHKTMKEVVQAYFTETNLNGGIYNRQLKLHTNDISYDSDQPLEMINSLLDSKDFFAMTACFLSGQDKVLTKLANDKNIPMVGAFSEYPEGNSLQNRNVFFLYAGIKRQIDALIQHSVRQHSVKIAVVYTEEMQDISSIVEEQIMSNSKITLLKHIIGQSNDDHRQLVLELKKAEVELVFYLGPKNSGHALLSQAAAIEWTPRLMLLGAFSNIDVFSVPKAFDKNIFLSYPTWMTEFSQSGLSFYKQLSSKYALSPNYRNMQFAALSSAILLTNRLKEIGSSPSREKLISSLEHLFEYQTGLIPPVSFNVNRRLGSEKVFITNVDLQQNKLILVNTIDGKVI